MDATEALRREMVREINSVEAERQHLEEMHGQVWDTSEMIDEFEALGFLAPFVVVRRRSDGVKGSLKFQHSPRYYFSFSPA
jgi:adenylate cyclase class IV